jgi:hypothetical protein
VSIDTDYVNRDYYCRICDQIHEIKLNKSIIKQQSKFPISHVFLHGELKNLLTTLYIDKDFEIRGVDVHELQDNDIFAADHVTKLINTLMEEIERLQNENARLIEKLQSLENESNSP